MDKTVLCYLNKGDSYLMLYRNKKENDINKGKYIGIGGHIEKGETKEQALIREVKEEIGLDIPMNKLIEYKEAEVVLRETNSHTTHYYYYKTNKSEDEFIIQEEELSEVKWFSIDDVIEMIKNHDNIVFTENKIKLFEGLKNV